MPNPMAEHPPPPPTTTNATPVCRPPCCLRPPIGRSPCCPPTTSPKQSARLRTPCLVRARCCREHKQSPSSTRFRRRCLFVFAASRASAWGGRPGQPPGRDTGRACPREQPERTGGGRPLLKSSLTCRNAPPPPCMDVALASSKRTFSKPVLENPWPPVLPTRVFTRATVGPCSVPPPGAPRPSEERVPVMPCLRCPWCLFRKGPRKGRHRIKQAWRAGRPGVLSKRCPNSRAGWPSQGSGRSWEAGLLGWAWSCFARGPSP
jgi:hypothetical protein